MVARNPRDEAVPRTKRGRGTPLPLAGTKITQGSKEHHTDTKPRLNSLQIIEMLREDILQRAPGEFLGSEPNMLMRYQVSRPTFRQIARVLEQEQLLTVKRGIRGGFFTRRPDIEAVGRAATNYLRTSHITLEHLHEVASTLSKLLARRAALSTNEETRTQLSKLRDKLSAYLGDELDILSFNALDGQFDNVLAKLADNPAIELQMAILHQVGMEKLRLHLIAPTPGLQHIFRAIRVRLADAVLAREPEVAEALMTVLTNRARQWDEEAHLLDC